MNISRIIYFESLHFFATKFKRLKFSKGTKAKKPKMRRRNVAFFIIFLLLYLFDYRMETAYGNCLQNNFLVHPYSYSVHNLTFSLSKDDYL